MATPFIIKRGLETSLPNIKTSGVMYFCTDTGNIYIDYPNDNNEIIRQRVAETALSGKQDTITGAASTVTSDDLNPNMVLVSNADGKIIADQNITSNELIYLNGIESNIQDQLDNKSNLSIKVDASLTASNWNSTNYIFSNQNITATNIVELIPSTTITTEEYEALQDAQIIGGAQAAGSITLKAMGAVPTINIPVIFIIRGDM